MKGSPELLEFYLVEATEYVDALDQLVGGATTTPDANAFIATARALRGSSTMAKADEIAELSLVIEQLAHALRDGELRWTLDLFQTMRGTVDDLRFLVRGVRMWGPREDARSQARLADLKRFLPGESARADAPSSGETAPVFVALQASAIAAELDAFVQNFSNRRALDDALTRSRTLRGIAGIAEYAPLGDVADAVDKTGRALMPDAPLAAGESELFRAAAAVLRRASDELRSGRPNSTQSDEVARFARAVAALQLPAATPDHVVAIDTLFYDDAGPHIVERRKAPVTPEQRFRQELASRGEHVARLVHDARQLRDDASRQRISRDLVDTLRDIERTASSFGAHQTSAFFGETALEPNIFSAHVLDALDSAARIVRLSESPSIDEMERRLALLERARRTPAVAAPAPALPVSPAAPVPPVSRASAAEWEPVSPAATVPATSPTPAATPAPAQRESAFTAPLPAPPAAKSAASATPTAPLVAQAVAAPPVSRTPTPSAPSAVPSRKGPATPTGRELSALLDQGIAAFAPLDRAPLVPPAPIDEDEIVPIESLLYKGNAALDRAIHLRDALRAQGFAADDTVKELFDLLDLARSE